MNTNIAQLTSTSTHSSIFSIFFSEIHFAIVNQSHILITVNTENAATITDYRPLLIIDKLVKIHV